MINGEDTYEAHRTQYMSSVAKPSSNGRTARGMTAADACAAARQFMCANGNTGLCQGSCDQIAAHVANNCTLYVGNDPVRIALTGSAQCPPGTVAPPNPTPTPTPQPGPYPVPHPGPSDNTPLIIAGLALAAVIGVVVMQAGRKKILVSAR